MDDPQYTAEQQLKAAGAQVHEQFRVIGLAHHARGIGLKEPTLRKLGIAAATWKPLSRASYEAIDAYGKRQMGGSFGLVALYEDWTRSKQEVKANGTGAPEGTAGRLAYQRLSEWSKRFGSSLDATAVSPSGIAGRGGAARLLSGGLFVRRSVQAQLVLSLQESVLSEPLLVTGEAGHGKSSLLWGVRRDLGKASGTEVFLVEAAWLIRPAMRQSTATAPPLSVDTVVGGAKEALNRGIQPVVLLDTADLLLRDDHTDVLLDLRDRLTAAEVRLVVTSRPEEARSLDNAFRLIHLGPYDDTEMAEAVLGHGRVYCPGAFPLDETARLRVLAEPEARGLPIREVCRNPLHLRLLFELASDDGVLPSPEIDVSGLYGRYWRHRVETDRRHGGTGRPRHNRNLAEVAGAVAVAIMSAGGTELSRHELHHLLAPKSMARGTPTGRFRGADLDAALEELVYRGVLLDRPERDGNDSYRFFHQTLFEFAAAHGLLDRFGTDALSRLVDWVQEHPRDFYVGAVLEQLLLHAASQPLFRDAARDTLARLAAPSAGVVLHNVAVAVAARHPGLGDAVLPLLTQVSAGVARRYVLLAPTVRDADMDALLPALEAVWAKGETGLRTVVLGALERLAAQNLRAVHDVLTTLGGDVQGDQGLTERDENLQILCRVLALTAEIDPERARARLMDVLTGSLAVSGTPRTGTAPQHSNELAITVLQLFARHWRELGSPRLAPRIRKAVVKAQPSAQPPEATEDAKRPHKPKDALRLRSALAEVLAASWTQDYRLPGPVGSGVTPGTGRGGHAAWSRLLRRMATGLEANDQDTRANAELIAVAQVLGRLAEGHWAIEPTLRELFGLTGPAAPFTIQRALATLLITECPAREMLLTVLGNRLGGLPASGNQPGTPKQQWAAVARNLLAAPEVPEHLVRTCVRPLILRTAHDPWLRADGLAALLVAAALGGHAPAAIRLSAARLRPATPQVRALVRAALYRKLSCGRLGPGPHMSLLIDLAIGDADATQLRELVTGRANRFWPQMPPATHASVMALLHERVAGLEDLISDFPGKGTDLREVVMLWDELVMATVLAAPDVLMLADHYVSLSDVKTRESVIRLIGSAVVRDPDQYEHARDFLLPLVTAGADHIGSGRQLRGSTAAAARSSLLAALCEAAPLDGRALELALDLATIPPTTMGIVSGLGRLIQRLAAHHGAVFAAEYLLLVVRTTTERGLVTGSKPENTLANGLRPAMDAIFVRRSARAGELIWQNCRKATPGGAPVLSDKYASLLVGAAARKAYETVLPDFREMLADPCVSDTVKGVITHHMRLRERSGTEQDLSWLLDGGQHRGHGWPASPRHPTGT